VVAIAGLGFAVIEEVLVRAVPGVRFEGESVAVVRSAFVVAVDLGWSDYFSQSGY
jgi:hypothetical protein